MLRNVEPTTLFIKDYQAKKEASRRRSLLLISRFWIVSQLIKGPGYEHIKKQRLFKKFGFDDQYQEWLSQIEKLDSICAEHPYRSAHHPPIPTMQEVMELCDAEQLKEAELFCEPVLCINASHTKAGWEVSIGDAITLKKDTEIKVEEGVLEKHIKRNEKIISILKDIRDSLYPLLYIFH